MNLFLTTLFGGLIAVLTPSVFPLLIALPILFEKLANPSKTYRSNILIFGAATVIVYQLVFPALLTISPPDKWSYPYVLNFLILVAQILFLLWFFSTFFEKFQAANKGIWQSLFRYLGIFIFSIQLTISSLPNIGPIANSMIISNSMNEETNLAMIALSGFSLGLVLPFLLVLWIFTKIYARINQKKWWIILQISVAGLLLLGSLMQLSLFLIPG